MKPTEELVHEHQVIKHMLKVLQNQAEKLEQGEKLDPHHLAQSVEVLRGFADQCHHAKEEDLLFPAMEAAGIPRQGGPIGVMLHEHEQGRSFVRNMAAAAADYDRGAADAGHDFAHNARDYVVLLTQHIDKEDHVLYPLADARLSPEKQEELRAAFARVELEETGAGKHEEYHDLVHALAKIYVSG